MTNRTKGNILKAIAVTIDVSVPLTATLTQFPHLCLPFLPTVYQADKGVLPLPVRLGGLGSASRSVCVPA